MEGGGGRGPRVDPPLAPVFAREQNTDVAEGFIFRHAAFRRPLAVGPVSGYTEVVDTVVDPSDNDQIPAARTATIPANVNVASIIELISIIVLTSFLREHG
jgi:hypothetical protein